MMVVLVIVSRNTMGWFDKYLGQYLERPQNMFYILNGLTAVDSYD